MENKHNENKYITEKSYGVKYISLPFTEYVSDISLTPLRLLNKDFPLMDIQYIYSSKEGKPEKIFKEYNIELYWNHKIKYESPKINLIFSLCNVVDWSAKETVLRYILYLILQYHLEVLLGDISLLGYSVDINVEPSEIRLNVVGYPEYFLMVLDKVVTTILTLHIDTESLHAEHVAILEPPCNSRLINHFKEEYRIELYNSSFILPEDKTKKLLEENVVLNCYSTGQLLDELDNIEPYDFADFNLLCGSSKIYSLVNGNLDYNLARSIGNILLKLSLEYISVSVEYALRPQIKETRNNIFYYNNVAQTNHPVLFIDDTASTMKNNKLIKQSKSTFSLDNDSESAAACRSSIRFGYLKRNSEGIMTRLHLLIKLLSQEYFHILRTKEQIGYSVNCKIQNYGIDNDNQYTTCDFIAVSHTLTGKEIYERTLDFIYEFVDYLESCTEEYINALISASDENNITAESLDEETMDEFESIVRGSTNKYEGECDITKESLIEFYLYWFDLEENPPWIIIIN